jgi:putative sigma-54 modulation protein
MDVVLKGRGIRITDQLRRTVEHKLAKLERLNRRAIRVEVEIIEEHNPRIGGHRVEVACFTARKTYRAEGGGEDVTSALDQAAQRLKRQMSSYRGRLRDRLVRRSNRLQSRTSTEESDTF